MARCARFWMAAVIGIPGVALGDVVTITPNKDNTMFEESGGWSDALGAGLFMGTTANGWARRALVSFDVAGSVPAGSTVTAVTLSFRCTKAHGSTNPASLHRALADWGEGTSFAPDPGGSGATATPGDATWTDRFYQQTGALWTTPGGDFVAAVSSSVNVNGSGVTYTCATSATFVADVQDMLDHPAQNFGWIVTGNTVAGSAKRLASREYSDPIMRPKLTVTFTPPPVCYANCDASTTPPILNVADFTCFLQKYANNDPYANCDASTTPPTLNVADFTCFLQKYATGCT